MITINKKESKRTLLLSFFVYKYLGGMHTLAKQTIKDKTNRKKEKDMQNKGMNLLKKGKKGILQIIFSRTGFVTILCVFHPLLQFYDFHQAPTLRQHSILFQIHSLS